MRRVARSLDVRPAALVALLFCVACASTPSGHAALTARETPAGPPPVAEPSPQPDTCGYWTDTYASLTERYGEIRDCLATDPTRREWLIATLGNAQSRGAIAVYSCSTAACTDGRADHPVAGWRIFPAPYPGGVTVIAQPSPSILLVDNGGHQVEFELKGLRFRT